MFMWNEKIYISGMLQPIDLIFLHEYVSRPCMEVNLKPLHMTCKFYGSLVTTFATSLTNQKFVFGPKNSNVLNGFELRF